MKILVTGGCGYLGAQFVRDYFCGDNERSDHQIRILDNLSGGSHSSLMNLPSDGHYEFIEGDILDPRVVRLAVQDVDVVVHLAAIVHTPMGYANPTWLEQVNHWGTSRLAEECLEAGVSHFVYASSIAVYGPRKIGDEAAKESDACSPLGPYAHSKYHAERSVLSVHARGLPVTILRFGILYGLSVSTRFDAVVNRFAFLAGIGRPLTVYGHGEQRRSFVHVRDASSAIDLSIQQGLHSEEDNVLNVVFQNASVLDIVNDVRELDPNVRVRHTDQDIRTRFDLIADSQPLMSKGWVPEKDIRLGLDELVHRVGPFRPISMYHRNL
jgi:UDP-glucose 4-epimerase